MPIWLGGEIKRFTVHRTVNRLRARVRRFRPIYIDIHDGGTRGRRRGTGEKGRKERIVKRETRAKGKGGRKGKPCRDEERFRFGEGKGKGPEKHLNKYACPR